MALLIRQREEVATMLSIQWREEVVTALSIRRRWSPLVLKVAEVVTVRHSWSWSPCAARGRGRHVPLVVVVVVVGAEVAHHRPPPPRHAATNRLRLAAANRLCLGKPSDITTTPSSRRGEPTAFDVGGTWCALPL
jgi:hypothetical protein